MILANYSAHTAKKSLTTPTYACGECCKKFSCEQGLNDHKISTRHGLASQCRYICGKCNKQFSSEQGLNDHVQTHMGHGVHNSSASKPRYLSGKCSKGAFSEQGLNDRRAHTGHGRAFDYNLRSQKLPSQRALESHINVPAHKSPHHQPFLGNISPPQSSYGSQGGSRPKIQPAVACHLCPDRFQSQTQLARHIVETHVLCAPCNKEFATLGAYEQHLQMTAAHRNQGRIAQRPQQKLAATQQKPAATKQKPVTPSQASRQNPTRKNFCAECQQQFYNDSAYQQHRNSLRHRPHTSDLKCSHCSRYFSAASGLMMHLESGTCRLMNSQVTLAVSRPW